MTLAEALRQAALQLSPASETSRLEAELLMAHALGVSRETMLLGDFRVPEVFDAFLARRQSGEPMAYITGTRDFWTISLDVTPDVLIPRPDSETLIAAAVEYSGGEGPCRILDLGTGSGALLLAALDQWQDATGLGIDASEAALTVARRNGDRIAPGRAAFRLGDWADGIDESFDLILCNPPYVEDDAELPRSVRGFEPHCALFAGAEGLNCYRGIMPALPRLLAPGGMIAVEIGHSQAAPVSELFFENGLCPEIRHDLAGRDRAVVHFALGNRLSPVYGHSQEELVHSTERPLSYPRPSASRDWDDPA